MKIIPFGDKILVKRRKVGERIGSLYVSDSIKESNTDLADVIHIPDITFADKEILENAEEMVKSLGKEARRGNSDALIALLRLNEFIKIKSIKEGDAIMLGKYVGIDFMDSNLKENMTLANLEDVIGLVVRDE